MLQGFPFKIKGMAAILPRLEARAAAVKLRGCAHFRLRVALSVLSGRPLEIEGIRFDDRNPGLRGGLMFLE